MTILSRAAITCGLAGTLALFAAAPSSGQIIVEPYAAGPYGYVGPYGGGPYGDYAYVPSYRGPYARAPMGYDTSGMPYSRDELGWQPGWRGGAPANPCWAGQRAQNRC